jgi:hypothetical protein
VEDQHKFIVRLRVGKNGLNFRGCLAAAPANGARTQLQFIAASLAG